MARDDDFATHDALVEFLFDRVGSDKYPSNSMLDLLESVLTPEWMPAYVELLLSRMRDDSYPSMPMIRRVSRIVQSMPPSTEQRFTDAHGG